MRINFVTILYLVVADRSIYFLESYDNRYHLFWDDNAARILHLQGIFLADHTEFIGIVIINE